jgi:alkylated DNA repair dioxygenase AlkB
METLFPLTPAFPPGFEYVTDFLERTEEDSLLKEIAGIELHTFNFHGYEAKRRVASFGFDYSFDKRSIAEGKEIPTAFRELIEKVSGQTGIHSGEFKELLVTEYPQGSVINWHRDAFPFDIIVGISLASDCTFRLRPHSKESRTRTSVISFPVKRRSLYVIQGPSRTDWEHSISPVPAVRYSVTLRTLKKTAG